MTETTARDTRYRIDGLVADYCTSTDQHGPHQWGGTYSEPMHCPGFPARLEAEKATAAAVSRWAVQLHKAELEPHDAMAWAVAGVGYDVAVQVATSPQITDEAREELLREIRTAVDATVKRVLCLKDA